MKISLEMRVKAEALAEADYQKVLGKTITIQMLSGYNESDDSVDLDGVEIQAVVHPTQSDDLAHWVDEYLDPYWNVEPVAGTPGIEGLRSFWTFGPSYRIVGDEIQAVDNNQSTKHTE